LPLRYTFSTLASSINVAVAGPDSGLRVICVAIAAPPRSLVRAPQAVHLTPDLALGDPLAPVVARKKA
jgi:hypothetical protein